MMEVPRDGRRVLVLGTDSVSQYLGLLPFMDRLGDQLVDLAVQSAFPILEAFAIEETRPTPADPWAHFKDTMQHHTRKNKREHYRR